MFRKSILSKSVSVLLVAMMVLSMSSIALADDYTDGYIAGKQSGSQHPTGAFGWSAAWGFGLGLIGGVGSFVYYAASDPSPGDRILIDMSDESSEYRTGYFSGYKETANSKVANQSALGATLGVLGAVLFVSAVVD